jgi:hypothetical protein
MTLRRRLVINGRDDGTNGWRYGISGFTCFLIVSIKEKTYSI